MFILKLFQWFVCLLFINYLWKINKLIWKSYLGLNQSSSCFATNWCGKFIGRNRCRRRRTNIRSIVASYTDCLWILLAFSGIIRFSAEHCEEIYRSKVCPTSKQHKFIRYFHSLEYFAFFSSWSYWTYSIVKIHVKEIF